MKKRAIVLGGIKHCGKSTLGRLAAPLLQRHFVDSDEALERLYRERCGEKLSSRAIFQREGETYFRQLEAETVVALLHGPGAGRMLLALGGGVPANPWLPPNPAWGTAVWLAAPRELVRQRIAAGGWPPFLPDGAGFEAWFAEREDIYRKWATVRFELASEETPEIAARRLAEFLESKI